MRAALLLVLLLASPRALAEVCREADAGLPEGPVSASFHEVDFARARRACLRSEVGLGGSGGAIIDTPNFYGTLNANGLLFGSWTFAKGSTELFATAEVIRWVYAQNATLKGTSLGLGQLSVGASRVVLATEEAQVTPSVRLMLPTATGEANVHVLGFEAGVASTVRPLPPLQLHGFAGAQVAGGVFSPAPSQPRAGALLVVGLQYSPWSWAALAVDLNARFGLRAALDSLAPAFALRFGVGRHVGVELAATLPVAGADRHDFAGALRVSYRL